MAYWIDSDVLIQACNDAYGFDFAPGFWEYFEEQIDAGEFFLPDTAARLEIFKQDDELTAWVKARRSGFIVLPNKNVQEAYVEIADAVNNGDYSESSKRGFLRKADGWLVAHARVDEGVIVTRERRPGVGSRVAKIPNVSDLFNVRVINQGDLLRENGVRLVRG